MVLNSIEKLIEKYDNGETTLKEEQQLKDYFSQETVLPHLEVYKSMFQYFLHTHEEQYTKDIPLKPRKTYSLYQWISVAAVAVIMLGVYFQMSGPTEAEKQEALLAYNQTMEMFNLVSNQLNKGTEGIETLNMVTTNFDKGTDNIAYLGEFSKTTNKILKTN
ncbi:hypothetical protein [Pontimicrobium sp. SW4]|uniref:Anti-sigma factor n=1 Tax=Pontimicrobium sp. SW4 TaxID=3153519 RepID=A0AAU7BWB1_9FLAO